MSFPLVLSPASELMHYVNFPACSRDPWQYMVSPDGQQFLMNTVTEEAASPITVILDWKPAAK